jgi:Uncharacterised nucleotidyltransferase
VTESQNGPIHPDVVQETLRLLGAAERSNLPIRVLGGMAIVIHAGELLHPSFRREIRDIDLATTKGSGRKVSQFLTEQGYEANRTFNAMHGAHRLLFYDDPHRRQVDVFVGTFEMCHTLPLTERMLLEPVTLPLAELVMTKLQIVKLNAKDRFDVYALLLTHDVGDHDNETINAGRIGDLCSKDWGLYRTFQLNLERLHEGLVEVDLSAEDQDLISERLRGLQDAIERAPKSAKWRVRAKVGDRVRWYDDPEEVGKGAY